MAFTTWVRAQDAFGQFDVIEGSDLPEGVVLVNGYPKHQGPNARDPKAKSELLSATAYHELRKAELTDEIDRRNNAAIAAGEEPVIEYAKGDKVADLRTLLELDDERLAEGQEPIPVVEDDTTTSDAESSGTGEDNDINAGTPGEESE